MRHTGEQLQVTFSLHALRCIAVHCGALGLPGLSSPFVCSKLMSFGYGMADMLEP